MGTLYVGELDACDLESLACLKEAILRVDGQDPVVLTKAKDVLGGLLPQVRAVSEEEIGDPEQIVVCGPFGSLDTWTAALRRAAGFPEARLWLHNISLPFHQDFMTLSAPHADLLNCAFSISARDHRTLEVMARWELPLYPHLLLYPERTLQAHGSLVPRIATGRPVLGICIRSTPAMMKAMQTRADVLHDLIAQFSGYRFIPLVTDFGAGAHGSDMDGTRAFTSKFLPDAESALPDAFEGEWLTQHMTPERFKALCGRCDAIITQRELPVMFASIAGVRVIGVAPAHDRHVFRAMSTLINDLHPSSAAVTLQ